MCVHSENILRSSVSFFLTLLISAFEVSSDVLSLKTMFGTEIWIHNQAALKKGCFVALRPLKLEIKYTFCWFSSVNEHKHIPY